MGGPGQGPIRDYDALVRALVARQGTLSRRNAQVAQFFLNHPEDVAINTIVRLATLAGVPPATITRFAQELGFQGFPDLQRVFRERLLGPRLPFAEQMSELTAKGGMGEVDFADLEEPGHVFDTFVQAAVNSLLRVRQGLDRSELEAAVAVLAAAETIHIAAARGAFGIGAYAFYGLANVGKRAQMIDNLGAMRVEQVAAMGERDALLAITFDDYTPETVQITKMAAEKGRKVVAITDNELSPVVGLAAHALYVREARLGHFRSQVPALVVAQAMIVSIGRRLAAEA
ncbi:MAG: MurR/RpiR family transcriptional regulator [Pseudomonadota bacterium]